MAHRDTVGHGDRAKLARGRAERGHTLFHDLRLAHQSDVAGSRLIPAARDADERLMDLLSRKTHRVIEGAVRCTVRSLGRMPAREFRLQTGLGVHSSVSSRPHLWSAGWPPALLEVKGRLRAGLDVIEWYGRIAALSGAIGDYA